jgi:quinol monooxygenase YgiN
MRKSLIVLVFMIQSSLLSMGQIDLHSHAITKGYLDYIKANGAEMDEGFPIPAWDAEQHIAFMDKADIQTAVLTMPAPQPWFGENLPLRQYGEKIVRLAEIDVVPEYLEEYMAFAKEVGETSVKVEPGVLTLFSMQTKEDPCKIYILEIYADQEAYQSHIQTAHFKKYKEGTAKMVKSLKLIDVNPLAGMIK